MTIKISFSDKITGSCGAVVLPLYQSKTFSWPDALDKKDHGTIEKSLKANDFKAKNGETVNLGSLGLEHGEIIVLGLGEAKKINALKAEEAGGKLCGSLKKDVLDNIHILIPETSEELSATELAAHLATGLDYRFYDFDKYKTLKDDNNGQGKAKKPKTKTIKFICPEPKKTVTRYKELSHIRDGVFTARDLVNEPGNVIHPDSYAKLVKKELEPLGVKIEILDEKKMAKLKMGAILSVGQGSDIPPHMVIMRWNGAPKPKKDGPLAFVGKGVTFDTGGISIKPSAGMDEMKMDMGGSAAVVGLMKTLALRKAKANVIGVIGLAENMPSGNATRPGDIVSASNGTTIEVLNTDAEGRMVLADCLTYVQEKHDPCMVINLATLTGAMMVALGNEYCGCFVNNDDLWEEMNKSSEVSGEKLWRMPLDQRWRDDIKGNFADISNLAKSGRWAGACTAAAFLEHFIDKDRPWSHMDIAGVAYRKYETAITPKFGTGFGVRVLNALVRDHYEAK